MPYGQPYGIEQCSTVTILMQHFHKFFGKFITGPYFLERLSHDVMGLPQDLAAKKQNSWVVSLLQSPLTFV